LIALLTILPILIAYLIMGVWVERKVAGFIQDRLGPMEVGYKGLLQTFADVLKLLQKEEIVAFAVDKKLFLVAPIIIFVSVFAGFAVIPLAPHLIGSSISTGLFYLLAIISIDVIGLLLCGWSSNSKYAVYGAFRAVAQLLSYEVPLGLAVLSIVALSGTLDLQEISLQQSIWANSPNYLFGLTSIEVTGVGGVLSWNIIQYPFSFVIFIVFFICTLAESNRAPFDLPEAESELIAGFQTEYGGFRWSVIMLGEYSIMMLTGLLGGVLFFGGWSTPLPNIGSLELANWSSGVPGHFSGYFWGITWTLVKVAVWIFLQMWARWTYPRLRMDQLMYLAWKVLTPAALVMVLISCCWKIWVF
jgi:NADH-quinone oxidoreductase subunit H